MVAPAQCHISAAPEDDDDEEEDETVADLFACGICDDVMLDPTTLACCGKSFCRRCLQQWIRTSVHSAGIPRCPGGCTQKVPFRLPARSHALRTAIEQLLPKRFERRKQDEEEHQEGCDDKCFGGFKAWEEVAANRDVIFGTKLGVRQGTPGIVVGNFNDGHHVTVRFDEREDGSELCVNVLPEALMTPLPGGFRLGQRVVALYDLMLHDEIGVRLGTGGAIVGRLGEDRLMVLFDERLDREAGASPENGGGPVSVSFREVAPQRLLAGGFRIAQQVQSAMDLIVGDRVVVPAGMRGVVLAEFSDTRLTVAFGPPEDGGQSCFNVLPLEIRPMVVDIQPAEPQAPTDACEENEGLAAIEDDGEQDEETECEGEGSPEQQERKPPTTKLSDDKEGSPEKQELQPTSTNPETQKEEEKDTTDEAKKTQKSKDLAFPSSDAFTGIAVD